MKKVKHEVDGLKIKLNNLKQNILKVCYNLNIYIILVLIVIS